MKMVILCIIMATSLFASMLDQSFITITNNNVVINNEAALFSYIGQLNDTNLTKSYQNAVEPINRLENPYDTNVTRLQTYEESFDVLRFFYEKLYDNNSSYYIDEKLAILESRKENIISGLLSADRKKLTDTSIVTLLVSYFNMQRNIDILNLEKVNMLQSAKRIVNNILEKKYKFIYDEKELTSKITYLNTLKNKASNAVEIAIVNNQLIVLYEEYKFINMIKNLQYHFKTKNWQQEEIPLLLGMDTNVSEIVVPSNNPLFKEYQTSLMEANISSLRIKLDQKIVNTIFSYKSKPEWVAEKDSFVEWAHATWDKTLDYTLFVFENNGVQVDDLFEFIKSAIFILLMQFIIVWTLKSRFGYNSSHLSIFITKLVVVCYLVYDFTTQVLGIDATNLTIFASAFSIALGFGMQSIIQNFVAGIIMIGEKTVKIGDYITLSTGQSGTVTNINYRTTTLKSDDNAIIMAPNSQIFLAIVTNQTKHDPKVRIKMSFLADKNIDFDKIESVLSDACESIDGFVSVPKPELAIGAITKDGLSLEFRLYVENSNYADTQIITKKLYSILQTKLLNDE